MKETENKQQDILAAERLRQRPAIISTQSNEPNDDDAEKITQRLHSLGRLPNNDSGTMAPIHWMPNFTFIKMLKINPKVTNNITKPYIGNLYYHLNKDGVDTLTIHHHLLSDSKLQGRLGPEAFVIYSINNHNENFRLGSALIQAAVEYSLAKGLAGKIELTSTRGSGQFYFKLGFLPKDETTLQELLAGKDIDAGPMYLPEASISAWKEISANQPILTKEFLESLAQKPLKNTQNDNHNISASANKAPSSGDEPKIQPQVEQQIARQDKKGFLSRHKFTILASIFTGGLYLIGYAIYRLIMSCFRPTVENSVTSAPKGSTARIAGEGISLNDWNHSSVNKRTNDPRIKADDGVKSKTPTPIPSIPPRSQDTETPSFRTP